MVSAIGSGGVVSAAASSGSSSSTTQIAALQKQITAAQKQLTESQKGEQTETAQKLQQQLAQQIQALQAQIAQLQAAAAQQAQQKQDSQAASSADTASSPARSATSTLGRFGRPNLSRSGTPVSLCDARSSPFGHLGRADRLGRAVENVVRNAIKHSPDASVISVVLSRHDDGRQVHVSVLDHGPGVAETDLSAIFEPFFRASNTQKSTDGHGLGLAIAQHVVKGHGGTIAARNRSSGGLCVEIRLPAKQPG